MANDFFFTYTCCNCSKFQKTYSVRIGRVGGSASAVKFGEIPPFGPPLSPRLISLIGPDYDLFMKGWRAERQGLGIGSFSYYRRVVENQKGRIIAEIRKAAESLRASDEFLKRLDRAKEETQFSEAIDLVKNAIPDRIKIRGHNPLTLLHRPLSTALHNLNDEQCLKQANAIRLVLAGTCFKDRTGQSRGQRTQIGRQHTPVVRLTVGILVAAASIAAPLGNSPLWATH